MLKEKQLFESIDKVKIAIERLKAFEPPEGYYLAFSGGKDSCVIKQLAIEAGVKFDAHYSVTTIDPPDLIYFIRKYHKDVIWERPKKPFLAVLVNQGFPMRHHRWCCRAYKENGGSGRLVITGLRWEESSKRKARKMAEHCMTDASKKFLHVIIDWSKKDVWQFIKERDLPYCCLYDEGWKRIGCMFCPMQSAKIKKQSANRYPRMENTFRIAFRRRYEICKQRGLISILNRYKNGDEMFDWWISGKGNKKDKTLWLFEG